MDDFIMRVQVAIIDPIITLLALAAFVVFIWGVVEFIGGAGDSEKREKGKKHIIWGLIGLVIIFGARAIVGIISATVNGV
ncbi:hypothetical protein K2Y00_01175 [Patescibacteria group bacterium]|nr:hypothetical protein [Patescibacteria group bacterium]